MDDFINKNILQEEIVLYRYEAIKLSSVIDLYKTRLGSKYIDYGFSSTTLLPYCLGMRKLKKVQKFTVLYKLYVPKGIPVVPLQFDTNQTSLKEYEMLLSTGTKRKLLKKGFNFKTLLPYFEFEVIED